jgi:hypothetical protein
VLLTACCPSDRVELRQGQLRISRSFDHQKSHFAGVSSLILNDFTRLAPFIPLQHVRLPHLSIRCTHKKPSTYHNPPNRLGSSPPLNEASTVPIRQRFEEDLVAPPPPPFITCPALKYPLKIPYYMDKAGAASTSTLIPSS